MEKIRIYFQAVEETEDGDEALVKEGFTSIDLTNDLRKFAENLDFYRIYVEIGDELYCAVNRNLEII